MTESTIAVQLERLENYWALYKCYPEKLLLGSDLRKMSD